MKTIAQKDTDLKGSANTSSTALTKTSETLKRKNCGDVNKTRSAGDAARLKIQWPKESQRL